MDKNNAKETIDRINVKQDLYGALLYGASQSYQAPPQPSDDRTSSPSLPDTPDNLIPVLVKALKGKDNLATSDIPLVMNFRLGCPEIITYLQLVRKGKIMHDIPFLDCIITEVQRLEFSPSLEFENGYIINANTSSGAKFIFINDSDWGSQKIISHFQHAGINLYPFKNMSSDADIIRRLLTRYMGGVQSKRLLVDPRAGLVASSGRYFYIFSDYCLSLPFLPFCKAALEKNSEQPTQDVHCYINELAPGNGTFFCLMISLFFWGTFFSGIRKKTFIYQGRLIFIRCKTLAILAQIKIHFSIWEDQKAGEISLSSPHKDFCSFLDRTKDRCLIINADTPDISKRRQKNLAILEAFVKAGIAPSGHPADALIILVGIDILPDIPTENLMLLEVDKDDIFTGHASHPRQASSFIHALIQRFNEDNESNKYFDPFAGITDTAHLLRASYFTAKDMLFQYFGIKLNSNFALQEDFFFQSLMDDSCLGDNGNLVLIIDEIEKRLLEGSINIRKNTTSFPVDELATTLIYDKKSLFINDDLLVSLLSASFQNPPSPVVFRKMLDKEQSLDKTGANFRGLQKRMRLKNGERPYGTAILIDTVLDYCSDEFKNFLQEEFL